MWDLKGDNVAAGPADVTTPVTAATSRLLVIDFAGLRSRTETRPDGKIFHDIVQLCLKDYQSRCELPGSSGGDAG